MLKWICERVAGAAAAQETPIGRLPTAKSLDTSGLDLSQEALRLLTSVDAEGWRKEIDDITAYYSKFDGRFPPALREQLQALRSRLG